MSTKPPLPPRKQGGAGPPKLPAKPPVVPLSTKPTQTFKSLSNKPVLPPRVPLQQNGPALPSRNKTTIGAGVQKYCGRQRPARYEARDFSIVDNYVKTLPDYASPRELSTALTCNFPDVVDKYRAVFCWLAFNVAYDADALLQNRVPPQSAENTFRNRLAVCAGYSLLFQALCDASRLHCIEVSGYAKGFGFDPAKPPSKGSNHAWNAVFVENEWRMIDATWGAGALNGSSFSL
jgi:transglutaminase-like putative cysteine protease